MTTALTTLHKLQLAALLDARLTFYDWFELVAYARHVAARDCWPGEDMQLLDQLHDELLSPFLPAPVATTLRE